MDKSVKKLIASVIITTILVIVSVPLWNYSSGRKGSILANSFGDLRIAVEIGKFEPLIMVEDERAMELIAPTDINLRNRNDETKKYELLLLVDKKSTISYEYLRVSLDKEIYNINELEMFEDNDNYYFLLVEEKLEAYSSTTKQARIWLDEDTKNLTETAFLTANFITR